MRLSLRFILPLLAVLGLFAWGMVPLADRLTLRWFERDLDLRSTLVASSSREAIRELISAGNRPRLLRYFSTLTEDERLFAVGYCAGVSGEPTGSSTLPESIRCADLDRYATESQLLTSPQGPLLVSVRPLDPTGAVAGRLVVVHDLSFIERRSRETRRYVFYFFAGLAVVVSLLTIVLAQLSLRGWIRGIRAVLRGEGLFAGTAMEAHPELRPIASDLRALIADLEAEHRARDEEQITWGPEALKAILHGELRGDQVIVVSNREPYIHSRTEAGISVGRPASGLVTALEPIMRACSGTWIAHGSGSADREVVDRHDRIQIPVDDPSYQLRRIWLTPEEEQGYYYGFANEGLWPLCHIAHVRPTFRTSDWIQYERANRKFADAIVQEAKSSDPIVLVQDYHLALVPRLVRERLPAATIITFWHIPWPNPEAFAICPWRQELLDGLLGSSILGFHTQFHCNNFVDTVDRQLEARVDRETFSVSYKGQTTAVKRYPISVEWPPSKSLVAMPIEECRARVRERHGLPLDHSLGLGVDRLDYTKGLEERFNAVERLLELHPEWIGKFTFIQIAAPTRASIEQYHNYEERVRALADRINERFARSKYPAIILEAKHHEPEQVYEYFRGADLCFVSSLHDGMNLVAKEFVAAREDDRGVLILSQFTGAARELPEALIVNPYDMDQCASALNVALTMPLRTQRTRMRLMRGLISEFNVYRWAGRMLLDAATMRRRGKILGRPLQPSRLARGAEETMPEVAAHPTPN